MPNMHDPNEQNEANMNQNNEHLNDDEDFEEFDVENAVEIAVEDPENEESVMNDMEDMELAPEGSEDNSMEDMTFEPERDDALISFSQHQGSVFCCHLDPGGEQLVVTGGEDDKAYVWFTDSGKVKFECTGHKDSVTSAAFSFDGKYVATADMSGVVQVWAKETGTKVWDFEVGDIEWLEWHSAAPVLFVGTSEGEIWMWKVPSGDTKTMLSSGVTCSNGAVLPDGKRLVAGYEDGSVKIWDLKSASLETSVASHESHQGTITSISCHPENGLIATGSTDCTAKLINSNNAKVVATFDCSTKQQDDDSEDGVEAVALCSSLPFLATGTLAGQMTLWDIPSQTARHTCKHSAGIVRLLWSPNGQSIFSCTLDGVVHQWDAKTGAEISQWIGHGAEILDMVIDKLGKYIITSSEDGTSKVFDASKIHEVSNSNLTDSSTANQVSNSDLIETSMTNQQSNSEQTTNQNSEEACQDSVAEIQQQSDGS